MDLKAINRDKVFIPEFMRNKEEEADKQIKVNYSRFPSAGEIGIYKTFRFKDGTTEVVYADGLILKNHVVSIENLSIGGKKIDTADKLYECEDSRLYDLIIEVRTDLLKDSEELEEGEA